MAQIEFRRALPICWHRELHTSISTSQIEKKASGAYLLLRHGHTEGSLLRFLISWVAISMLLHRSPFHSPIHPDSRRTTANLGT